MFPKKPKEDSFFPKKEKGKIHINAQIMRRQSQRDKLANLKVKRLPKLALPSFYR